MEDNKLKGLSLAGFGNEALEFDAAVFEDTEKIELIRAEIRKFFIKTEAINSDVSSYSLAQILAKHLGTDVANGELVYAMHLEGFRLAKRGSNCRFNIRASGIRHLENSKYIISLLETAPSFDVLDQLISRKSMQEFKYHLKLIVDLIFEKKSRLKKDVYIVLAQEINVPIDTLNAWINLSKLDKESIPKESLNLIATLFGIAPEKLINTMA